MLRTFKQIPSKAVKEPLGGKGGDGEDAHSPPPAQAGHTRSKFCPRAAKHLSSLLLPGTRRSRRPKQVWDLDPSAYKLTGWGPYEERRPDSVAHELQERPHSKGRASVSVLDPTPSLLTVTQRYSGTPVPIGGAAASGELAGHCPGPPLPAAPQTGILRAARSSSQKTGLEEYWELWGSSGVVLGHPRAWAEAWAGARSCPPPAETSMGLQPTARAGDPLQTHVTPCRGGRTGTPGTPRSAHFGSYVAKLSVVQVLLH